MNTDNPNTDYWYKNYCNEHCTLCGNSGRVKRGVKTAAGVEVGRINFCICPNGQILRAHDEEKPPPGSIGSRVL